LLDLRKIILGGSKIFAFLHSLSQKLTSRTFRLIKKEKTASRRRRVIEPEQISVSILSRAMVMDRTSITRARAPGAGWIDPQPRR
jgi:hypothetical protein